MSCIRRFDECDAESAGRGWPERMEGAASCGALRPSTAAWRVLARRGSRT